MAGFFTLPTSPFLKTYYLIVKERFVKQLRHSLFTGMTIFVI